MDGRDCLTELLLSLVRQMLQSYEKTCLKSGHLKEAELAVKRIEELQKHEFVYRSLSMVERNKEEVAE